MIVAIMLYNETGLLVYEKRFERCELNCDLITGFVTAINQFGCELFPNNDLCDILFSNTRMLIEPRDVEGKKVTFLVIHGVFEDQEQIMQIIDALHDEVKRNYANAIASTYVIQSKFEGLDTFLVDLFQKLNRSENPYACALDE
ncbi:MAG TPA: hypothetical protein VKM55_10490 [Candidatus Lokiarchaeia archaeon]|nr:hypothetical protein [Candidatus Lokiarchaeia archaeon]